MNRINLLANILVFLILTVSTGNVSAEQQADTELKRLSSHDGEFQIIRGDKRINLDAMTSIFTDNAVADKEAFFKVLVLRDPKTGLSWWGCQESPDPYYESGMSFKYLARYAMYLTGNALGGIEFPEGSNKLWLNESKKTYPSLLEANTQALNAFIAAIPKMRKDGCHSLFHAVDLPPQVPKAFFYGKPTDPSPKFLAKVEAVGRTVTYWNVLVSGADNAMIHLEVDNRHHARQVYLLTQVGAYNTTLQTGKDNDAAELQAKLFAFTNPFSGDGKPFVKVLVLWDPKTGLSWWGCQESANTQANAAALATYLKRYHFYLAKDTLGGVLLTADAVQALWIRESTAKQPSMSVATAQALQEFTSFIPEILRVGSKTLFHEDEINGRVQFLQEAPNQDKIVDKLFQKVDMSYLINFDFYVNRVPSAVGVRFVTMAKDQLAAKFESVQKINDGWKVSLSGAENAKVDVEIDSHYKVKKVEFYPNLPENNNP